MNKNHILVSIIIVTYYHEKYIENAIKSVLAQECDFDYEILISDDASNDNTVKCAEQYRNNYPDIIQIHINSENVGTTRNLYDAFLRAKGTYITLLSGDDVYSDPKKLSKQVTFLEQNKNCYAVGVSTRSVYTDGEPTGVTSPKSMFRGKYFSQKKFAMGDNYPIHGIMFRNCFEQKQVREQFYIMVKFSKYIEDLTLCLLLFELGKVYILEDIGYDITTRREGEVNQHNFNSIISICDNHAMHIELIKKLQNYFGKKINLKNRLSEHAWNLFCIAIKQRQLLYLKYMKGIPLSCFWKGMKQWLHRKRNP